MVPGTDDITTARNNAMALQATINAAVAGCTDSGGSYGAIVLIPSNDTVPSESDLGDGGVYYIAAPTEGQAYAVEITCYFPILICGTGTGTILHMIEDSIHMFNIAVSSSGDENVGGISFQDLQFQYDTSLTAGAAIFVGKLGNVSGAAQNLRLFRCVFTDVPQGVHVTNTLQFFMMDCTLQYEVLTTGTILTVGDQGGASETSSDEATIAGCAFSVASSSSSAIGLFVGGVNQLRCRDLQFNGFQTAIQINPGESSVDLAFTNIVAYGPGSQLTVTCTTDNFINGLSFVNCTFNNDLAVSTASAVILDPGSNAALDTVRFVSCTCTGNAYSGLEIDGGQHIEILGGEYAGNSQASGSSAAGIWIEGAPSNVRIVGASLVASVYGLSAQKYALTIGSGASDIFVSDCDMTGYHPASPLDVSTSVGTNVEVVNCPGYNDQGTLVAAIAPASATPFNGASYKYYGPVQFFVTGGTYTIHSIKINGNATQLTSGTFRLEPGSTPNATISYTPPSPPGPDFIMIGL